MEWHYAKQGRQLGPVALAELSRMAASGELLSTDLVWKQGMAQWRPAREIDGVFPNGAGASGLDYAGFGVRLAARAVDIVFVIALGLAGGFLCGFLLVALQAMGRLAPGWQDRLGGFSVVGFLSGLAATTAYHAFCEGLHGATLGKYCLGLRVAAEDGAPCGVKRAFRRSLAFYFDGLLFGVIGWYSISRSGARQRYGDVWAKTVVVQADSLPPESQRTKREFAKALAKGAGACVAFLALGLLLKVLR
jgi:uncharacterized RDD family membrane protein YckC